jgi:hypothetical protein
MTLNGCFLDGDDGTNGVDGAAGPAGPQGPQGPTGPSGNDGSDGSDASGSTISLSVLGRYSTGQFDESAAEIVSFDPATQFTFVVNAQSGQVDVIDSASPAAPVLQTSINVAADVAAAVTGITADDLGAVNSVSVYGGVMAASIEADPKQNNGYIAFYQADGTYLNVVEAGALPDMVTFSNDGMMVVAANEGEPNGDYSNDPEGSVTIVDLSNGVGSATATQVSFTDFNVGGSKELTGPVRVSAKATSVAADLEPEYLTISEDNSTAFVAMQENNAVAVIDLVAREAVAILGIGFKSFNIPGNEIDASNRDSGVNIRNWPVYGTYMPDAIASYTYDGVTYLVTANEGDGREYLTDAADAAACTAAGGFDFDDGDCFHYLDEIRIKDIPNLDIAGYDSASLQEDANLGRLKVITDLGVECTDPADTATLASTGQPGATCTYTELYSFGARSMTIWNSETGQPVFDTGNDFEVITANRYGADFNASNDENGGDDRSDDKGPEPEGIALGVIDGKTYAFIGLERMGGIMVYNISNPEVAEFVQYINPRDLTIADAEADLDLIGDLGPEGLYVVDAADSPTGNALLIVGNEVSGTTTFYNINITNTGG